MEDHLKNKNRLEREWEALCSYQAEPSVCGVGQGEQNSKRNRSDAVVVCESAQMSIHFFFFFFQNVSSCENVPTIYEAGAMQLHHCC